MHERKGNPGYLGRGIAAAALLSYLAPSSASLVADLTHEVYHAVEHLAPWLAGGHPAGGHLASHTVVHAHGPGEPVHTHAAPVNLVMAAGAAAGGDGKEPLPATASAPSLDTQLPADRVADKPAPAPPAGALPPEASPLRTTPFRDPPVPPPRA